MSVTGRGIGLLAAGAAALVAGFAFGYAELGLLGTAALLAVACAVGYAGWRPTLSVRRSAAPDRVARGETCTVTLTVHNSSRLRAATLVAEDRCGTRDVPVPLVRLRPRRDTTVSYPVPTDRRGVVPVGPLRVTRHDPLGLVAVLRQHGDVVQVWVHPRIHPLTAVPAGVARSLDGRIDRVPHGSITFDALREYVIGDELRHVHWRTTARVGELMVREHLDTSLPRIAVLLDDRAGSYPDQAADGTAESFESACEAAASVVAAAVREDLPIALHLVSGAGADSGGRRATHGARQYLDLLAEATLHPDSAGRAGQASGASQARPANVDTAGALRSATDRLRQRPVGDTLVYLTGPGAAGDLGAVAALRGRYPSVLVGVLGPDAPAPPATAGLVVLAATDGEEFAAEWDGVRAW